MTDTSGLAANTWATCATGAVAGERGRRAFVLTILDMR